VFRSSLLKTDERSKGLVTDAISLNRCNKVGPAGLIYRPNSGLLGLSQCPNDDENQPETAGRTLRAKYTRESAEGLPRDSVNHRFVATVSIAVEGRRLSRQTAPVS